MTTLNNDTVYGEPTALVRHCPTIACVTETPSELQPLHAPVAAGFSMPAIYDMSYRLSLALRGGPRPELAPILALSFMAGTIMVAAFIMSTFCRGRRHTNWRLQAGEQRGEQRPVDALALAI